MGEVDREMQTRNLIALAKSPDGFKFTNTFFPYTSGEIGPYYVQSGGVLHEGKAYAQACKDMTELVVRSFGGVPPKDLVISGGESRDWMFSAPVAERLELPYAKIYKDGKIVGASMKDRTVAHVADLNNEGSSPRDLWVPVIKREGGNPQTITFFVDRLEDGVGVMQELGLRSNAVIPLDEYAWGVLQKEGIITPDAYNSLRKRMENKDIWAHAMLRNRNGLETLAALLASGKTREKGQKILNIGYPDLKDELVEALKKQIGFGITRWLK
ncbi:MAG: hypothetical protein KKB21_01210 [Nanoarchaeota archaeon]|nr:hypothetical protein [Nanoarchaeota archaeon]MBU4086174.1 hypothetical protein [Nanoarchaeota archaeon]